MDLEILPTPSEEERQAILEALRAEAEQERDPTPWCRVGRDPDGGLYATAPRRHKRGATRA